MHRKILKTEIFEKIQSEKMQVVVSDFLKFSELIISFFYFLFISGVFFEMFAAF